MSLETASVHKSRGTAALPYFRVPDPSPSHVLRLGGTPAADQT